jgi:hypothetical protein
LQPVAAVAAISASEIEQEIEMIEIHTLMDASGAASCGRRARSADRVSPLNPMAAAARDQQLVAVIAV